MSDASDFDAVRDGIGVDTGTSSGDEETMAAAHAALDRLESQNQALQERAEKAESMLVGNELWVKTRAENQALQERIEKAEGLIRAWDDLPAQVADLTEMLNDADADKRALQERAEKAEAALREAGELAGHMRERYGASLARIVRTALSPTQEADHG